MTLTPERLAELCALAEAATPGPWFHVLEQDGDEDGPNGQDLPTRTWLMPIADDAPVAFSQETAADAAFIAAWNPETAKALLDLLAEKDAEIERLSRMTNAVQHTAATLAKSTQDMAGLAHAEQDEVQRLRAELDERETVARSRHNRVIHQRDEWARRATEAEAAAGGEVGKFRGEIARLMEAQRDANALARQLADAVGERDTAIEEAEAAIVAKHQTENDLSSQIVTLELNLEDALTDRDAALARLAAAPHAMHCQWHTWHTAPWRNVTPEAECNCWKRAALADGGTELAVGGEEPTKPPVELDVPSADLACTESTPCFDAAHYPSELCSVHRAEFFKWRAARADGGGIDESN